MNSVSFQGGETAGSIGKKQLTTPIRQNGTIQTPQCDSVNFRGREDREQGASVGGILTAAVVLTAAVIGGLGYAHKANWVSKLKDGKFKDATIKATETCYNWCAKTKDTAVKYYEKVKNFFSKKS